MSSLSKRLAILFLLALIHLSAAAAPWKRAASPADAGWSPEKLQAAKDYATEIGSMSWMVVQHGVVIDQFGPVERLNSLHSARKSIVSALFGIAVHERKVKLKTTLAQLGIDDNEPSLTAAEKKATVRDLLMARSGVYHAALGESPAMKAGKPARGSHPHGTFWYYNNWDFNALGTILHKATGQTVFDYFAERIAKPLQFEDFVRDEQQFHSGPESQHDYYDFQLSTRDLARFGELFLRLGRWDGTQIVPVSWVDESTTPYSNTVSDVFPQGMGHYGYMWWVAKDDHFLPNAHLPTGSYAALGVGPQIILVVPSKDLVLVHRVDTSNEEGRPIPMGKVGTLIDRILAAAP